MKTGDIVYNLSIIIFLKITEKCIVCFLHMLFLCVLIYIVHNNDCMFSDTHKLCMCIVCFWIAENCTIIGGDYYYTFYTTISVNVCTYSFLY